MNIIENINEYKINGILDIDKIIDDYTPYIKTIINSMVNNNLNYEDKEEIISDVFFVLWKNQHIGIKSLKAYIVGTTKNLVKEKLRKRKFFLDISDYQNVISVVEKSFEIDINEIDKLDKVNAILKQYKMEDRIIIKLFYYKKKSTKEIAERLKISEVNVRKKLSRLRKKIKNEIEKGGKEDGRK